MDGEKNQRKSARENSEKRFHANVRRLKTQMDADKKISVDLREKKIRKLVHADGRIRNSHFYF